MHVAIVSTPFVPVPPEGYGGTELVVSALVQGLAAEGHRVTLYATGDSRAPAEIRSRYTVAAWPPEGYRELTHAAWAIADLQSRRDVDVVHCHIASMLPFADRLDVPLVYTVHHARDAALEDLYDFCRHPRLTMIGVSDRQRELIPHIQRTVHHGLDPSRYPPGAGQGGYAAFIGRFAREKGAHTAIDVARRARVPLHVGGRFHAQDASYFHTDVAWRLQLDGVTYVGEVSHAPKVELLRGAIATLFPIDWEEPFGLVMIESMLCGTPVLAFARGAAPEVIDEGITGWVVEEDGMTEQLARLARGAERFDRARCREHAARRFGTTRMVRDYLDVFREAMQSREANNR